MTQIASGYEGVPARITEIRKAGRASRARPANLCRKLSRNQLTAGISPLGCAGILPCMT